MWENGLTFKDEKLTVDWVGFKFQNLDNFAQTKLSKYFLNIGFNSYRESGKLAKPVKEPIFVNFKNNFQVLFIDKAPYWEGTSIQFSGTSAAYFYTLIKRKLIDWKLFSSATLGRFDLNYLRENEARDRISTGQFLYDCEKKLMQTNKIKNISLEKNSKGLILKIGSRRSNNYSRVYEGKNSLKFEHEMKGKFIKNYHTLLIQNSFEEFEHKLSLHFLTYFGKVLPLEYSYLNWLVLKLRPVRKQNVLPCGLNSDYIESEALIDSKNFVTLIQFLNYIQILDFETKYIDQIPYRVVVFRLTDFIQLQNKQGNQYQLVKVKRFLQGLRTEILITSFSDTYFQSLVAIPLVKFTKLQKFWVVRVWVAQEFFCYKYPFYLPHLFQQPLKKDQLEVRVQVFKIFSSKAIDKVFRIKEFFENYPSRLSNQQKTKMKGYFIQSIKLFQRYDLIENDYKIISNGFLLVTDTLTPKNIYEGFVVYEKLHI
jgi:hypothetical protein